MQESRSFYPRGLHQPESGFRFSLDALLLACYPKLGKTAQILDLGCGCGVIGLGVLLLYPEKNIQVTAVDIVPEMVEYARMNAQMLNLHSCFQTFNLDIKQIQNSQLVLPESFDQVLVNPPYRKPGEGRHSPKPDKHLACFEGDTQIGDFFLAAAYALKNKGRVCLVYPASSQVYFWEPLLKNRLEPKRMRYVHSRNHVPASFVLLEAIKNGGRGLTVQPPLYLYNPEQNSYSGEALQYCPFLECNREPRS